MLIENLKNKLKQFFSTKKDEVSDITLTDIPVVLTTDDVPIRKIGFTVLFIMFGVFGTWSYVAPINSSSLALGVVSVKSHRQTIQHLEGGIVSKIYVHDGNYVSLGDPLLTLDNTKIKAQIEILRGHYISAAAINARLTAEREQTSKITFPNSFEQLNDLRVKEATQGQQQIFIARSDSFKGELDLLRQRVKQLGLKITGLNKQKDSKHQLVRSYSEEINELKDLLADGYTDKQRLRELQRHSTMTNSEIDTLDTEVISTKMQQGETKLQILQTTRKFQEQVATQLEEVNAELFHVNEQLIVAEDSVLRSEIKAPVKGYVLGMSAHTEGGVVGPGSPILDIVPEDEELVIVAQVSVTDIDKVKIGTTAEIRFSAFSNKTTPMMEGTIKTISADRLQDEVTGMPYYKASIRLTEESQKKLGNLVLIPGMPAEVLINTGKRTLFEYLFQPLTDAFARSFVEG